MKNGFTLIQLLAIIIILLIIFWLIMIVATGKIKNIDCYMTTKGLICNYGKLGE